MSADAVKNRTWPARDGAPLALIVKPDSRGKGAVSFSMQALKHTLTTFFEQAAKREMPLLRELEQDQRFAVKADRWCFTLPALFSFLQQRSETMSGVSYNDFRRAIYSTPINASIDRFAAEVVIDQNHGQVDTSVYALTWRKRDDEGITPPTTPR